MKERMENGEINGTLNGKWVFILFNTEIKNGYYLYLINCWKIIKIVINFMLM